MFTDMALTAYEGSEGLDVVVRSLKSAKVLPGLKVSLVARNGETLGLDIDGQVSKLTANGAPVTVAWPVTGMPAPVASTQRSVLP